MLYAENHAETCIVGQKMDRRHTPEPPINIARGTFRETPFGFKPPGTRISAASLPLFHLPPRWTSEYYIHASDSTQQVAWRE